MRPGWNPTRRNRNIGTARRGYDQSNRMVIPKGWPDDRVYWEVLRSPVVVERAVGSIPLTFLIEPPRRGSFHACTLDDIGRVLAYAAPEHLRGIALIVLRQPTRKEEKLRPVWGRLAYHASMGPYSGTAIYLEAQTGKPRKWPLSLSPEDSAELERLRTDGHLVTMGRRGFRLEYPPGAIRTTQLYRTLLHELGHYVDWLKSVLQPARDANEAVADRLARAYRAKAPRAKEDFAHRYAAEVARRIPRLAQILDREVLRADGLSPAWFLSEPAN